MKNVSSVGKTSVPDGDITMEMAGIMDSMAEIPEKKAVRAAGGGMGIGRRCLINNTKQ